MAICYNYLFFIWAVFSITYFIIIIFSLFVQYFSLFIHYHYLFFILEVFFISYSLWLFFILAEFSIAYSLQLFFFYFGGIFHRLVNCFQDSDYLICILLFCVFHWLFYNCLFVCILFTLLLVVIVFMICFEYLTWPLACLEMVVIWLLM